MKKIVNRTGAVLLLVCFSLAAVLFLGQRTAYADEPNVAEPITITYRQNLTRAGDLAYYVYVDGTPQLLSTVWNTNVLEAELRLNALFTLLAQEYTFAGKKAEVVDYSRLHITLAEYDDYDDYYIAQGRDGYETGSSDSERIRNGMFTIYKQTSDTPFAELEGSILGDLFERVKAAGVPADSILFVYEYATKYSTKMIRTNADSMRKEDEMTVHRFEMKDSERAEKQVVFYQRVPETWTWYLLALAVGAVCVGGAFGYLYYRKRRTEDGGREQD